MSAGNICVHSNLGALYETASNWTHMYQYSQNTNEHANMFYSVLDSAIDEVRSLEEDKYHNKIMTQKTYADVFYQWNIRKLQWQAMLNSIASLPKELPKQQFVYRT